MFERIKHHVECLPHWREEKSEWRAHQHYILCVIKQLSSSVTNHRRTCANWLWKYLLYYDYIFGIHCTCLGPWLKACWTYQQAQNSFIGHKHDGVLEGIASWSSWKLVCQAPGPFGMFHSIHGVHINKPFLIPINNVSCCRDALYVKIQVQSTRKTSLLNLKHGSVHATLTWWSQKSSGKM